MSNLDLARLCQSNMRHWYVLRALAAGGEHSRRDAPGYLFVDTGLMPGSWRVILPFPARAEEVSPVPSGEAMVWATIGVPLCDLDVRQALKTQGFAFASAALTMARTPGAPAPTVARTTWELRDLAKVQLPADSWHPS